MNWDHIKAVMGGWKKVATVGEQRVLTNGHIEFLVPADSPLIDGSRDYPAAAALWERAVTFPVEPQPLGELYSTLDGYHYRKLGIVWVSEQYFRCFNEPGATWTHADKYALAHDSSGTLVGVVMPCKPNNGTVCENQDVSDSDIFSPYASEDNNWYLVNEATLYTRIEEAEDERDAAESKRDELDGEIDEWDAELSSLNKRLKSLAGTDRTASPEAEEGVSPKEKETQNG